MPRISSEKATNKIGNRYDMILIATVRARELKKGGIAKVSTTEGPVITALKEIEAGHIGREYLAKVK